MASDFGPGVIALDASTTKPCDLDITVAATTLARHQQLLTTNQPPEGPELTLIRSVVSKTGARLEHLDDEIARLRVRLRQLEEERGPLTTYHAQNKAILSPLRRMPLEVLAEIFSWTLPPIRDILNRRRFDAKDSPWVLTHVCCRWRTIALSIPSLWSLVVISGSRMSANPLSLVKTQIQRAHTLKIHFYGHEKHASRPQIEMFQLLAEHSSRWEEFRVNLTSDLFPLLACLRHRLASLRRLWIQWDGRGSSVTAQSIDCFQGASCLVDAGICNDHRVSFLLPAHQLTHYDLNGSWEMHRGILKLAPNLIVASITLDSDREPWGEVIGILRLQRLHTLDPEILNFIKAPALTEIALYVNNNHDLAHLEPFVARSGCTLGRLSLQGRLTAHLATHVLPKYPSITELVMTVDTSSSYNMTNAFISHLTIPNPAASTAISPQLSEISFAFTDDSSCDYSLYLRMLRSRWKPDSSVLKRAALLTNSHSVPGPDPATISRLNALRQGGLDLCLMEGKEAKGVMNDWIFVPRWFR
ncbi:hypothetical protein C8R44DRAFT_855803 [Mycena epipterygia]|nr:hypothetical protein C8R44DRAFT_855803 [Mycena epipterygia]